MSSLTGTSGFDGRSGGAWWAESKKSRRGAIFGAIFLVAALSVTSVLVWVSPNSPVKRVTEVVEAVTGTDVLKAERSALLDQLVDTKGQLSDRKEDISGYQNQIAALQAQLTEKNATIGTLQSQLASTQAELVSAQKALATRVTTGNKTTGGKAGSVPTPGSVPSKAQLLAPANPYFGMYTDQAPFNWATYDATSLKVGAQPDVVGFFAGWDQEYRANAVQRAWAKGTMPLMTWESRPIAAANDESSAPEYQLSKIINGDFDAYLTKYAQDIVATGLPLGIRLDHEMNGNWYPWSENANGNSAGEYVKMWQHVHDIFQQQGANELVIWVWAPNRVDKIATAQRDLAYTQTLYPGDAYVDWVGMSGYLRPPFKDTANIGFQQTFSATLSQLRTIAPNKPIFLAEVGASEIEGHKVQWLQSFFQGMNAPENSDIIGFAWFSLAITSYVDGERATNDWRIDSRADSLQAFSQGLLTPGSRFAPRAP